MMRARHSVLFSMIIGLGLCCPVVAKDTWTSIQTSNFLLVGNASERDIRSVAQRLEQFRDAFSRLFPDAKLESANPVTVIVFKDEESFRPYKPLVDGKPASLGGFFATGDDRNFIAVSASFSRENADDLVFHEYVHALTANTRLPAPVWFREGIAEFYSTVRFVGDRKVAIGPPVSRHVRRLRDDRLIPLQQLFAVTQDSELYNERAKQGIFYAQSWALVHYLLLGNESKRQPQLNQFINLLAAGRRIDDAFRQAFGVEYKVVEEELDAYIRRSLTMPFRQVEFDQKLDYDRAVSVARISDAEAETHLGNLLIHIGREADSENVLRQASQAAPDRPEPQTALGRLRVRQRRFPEAREFFAKSAALDSRNATTYFYQALTYFLESDASARPIEEFSAAELESIQASLRRAIALDSNYAEAHYYLGYLEMVLAQNLDEAEHLLARATELAPAREDIGIALANLMMRKRDFAAAQKILEPIARGGTNARRRTEAQGLLDTIATFAEQVRSFGSSQNRQQLVTRPDLGVTEEASPAPKKETVLTPVNPPLKPVREGEQVRGLLTVMDCTYGLTLTIRVGTRAIALHTDRPDSIEFTSFVPDVQTEIRCGRHEPGIPVNVLYKPSPPGSAFAGEPLVVEFVKP